MPVLSLFHDQLWALPSRITQPTEMKRLTNCLPQNFATLTVPIVAREIFSFNNELVDELIYAFIAINAIYASILIGIGFKYGEKYTKCGKAQLIAAIFYCIFLYYASLINYS